MLERCKTTQTQGDPPVIAIGSPPPIYLDFL